MTAFVAGRIVIEGAVKGSAFPVAPRLALTARHVVREALLEADQLRADINVALHLPDQTLPILSCRSDRRLDVAILDLADDADVWFPMTTPRDGASWRALSQPQPGDAALSGEVTLTHWPFRNAEGEDAELTQLHVREGLGDYAGYSGSPVSLWTPDDSAGPPPVFAILIEQVPWRTRPMPGQRRPPVSTVLIAAPIPDVLAALDLTHLPLVGGQQFAAQASAPDDDLPQIGHQGSVELAGALDALAALNPGGLVTPRQRSAPALRMLRDHVAALPTSVERDRVSRVLEDLLTALGTVTFLRSWAPHELTSKALRRGLATVLPGATAAGDLQGDVDYLERVALQYPDYQDDARLSLVRFVLAVATAMDKPLDDPPLIAWARGLVGLVAMNDQRAWLQRREQESQYRLIIGLHDSPAGGWPQSVDAWLLRGPSIVQREQFPCQQPTEREVTTAVAEALDWAVACMEDLHLDLRRVDLALPTGLLTNWRPEEVEVGSRLGLHRDVVVCWSGRMESRTALREARARMSAIARGEGDVLHWLDGADVRDLSALEGCLKGGAIPRAVGLRFQPAAGEAELLELLLSSSPILLWPDAEVTGVDLLEQAVRECWLSLPTGLSDAYREGWRAQPGCQPLLAQVRAVWDDEEWLAVCSKLSVFQAQLPTASGGRT